MCVLSHFSQAQFFVTLWTVAHQVLLPMGFSRQGYWSGLPCHLPGDHPSPGIYPMSLMSPVMAGGSDTWQGYVGLIAILPIVSVLSASSIWYQTSVDFRRTRMSIIFLANHCTLLVSQHCTEHLFPYILNPFNMSSTQFLEQ